MRTLQILRMRRKLDGDLWLNAKKKEKRSRIYTSSPSKKDRALARTCVEFSPFMLYTSAVYQRIELT